MTMTERDIVVSLLIPVYNVARYLEEALASAVGQTLQDIEIICIDDGSTDGSDAILDAYAARDKRMRVVHKENDGYGRAMNLGLELARGRYIALLEPDDFIEKHMLSDLYALAEKYQLDFVKSDFATFEGEPGDYQVTPTHIYWQTSMYGKVLSEEERRELFRGYLAHWACLYRRSFIEKNHIRFHESPGASYQDTGFWFQTMALAERVYLHDGCYYHYRQDNPGASMQSREKVYCITDEYKFIYQNLEARDLLASYWPQFVTFAFIGHRDALQRIGDSYKQDFIQHTAHIFNQLRAEGRLDMGFMDRQDREMLDRIMSDPEKYYRELMVVPSYIHEQLRLYRDFYIYGAGTRGKKILKYMAEEDASHCRGFLVTQAGSARRLLGMPVLAVDDVSIGSQTGVVIGVTDRYSQEVLAELQRRGIETAVVMPEDKVP